VYAPYVIDALVCDVLMNGNRAYGPVQDVRIPHQQKRMFGFVTFIYPDTVRTILTEGNPHYICGARVLVKPYKEKGRKCKNRFSSFFLMFELCCTFITLCYVFSCATSASPAAIHRERQGVHLVLQEEKPNIELPRVVEQELRQVEMNGNEQKEATLNPIGTKTDASEFDMAGKNLQMIAIHTHAQLCLCIHVCTDMFAMQIAECISV
jgi:hypothetical protein